MPSHTPRINFSDLQCPCCFFQCFMTFRKSWPANFKNRFYFAHVVNHFCHLINLIVTWQDFRNRQRLERVGGGYTSARDHERNERHHEHHHRLSHTFLSTSRVLCCNLVFPYVATLVFFVLQPCVFNVATLFFCVATLLCFFVATLFFLCCNPVFFVLQPCFFYVATLCF